jgi:exonuclease III
MMRRKKESRDVLIAHLNINSLQNKIEELKDLNTKIKAQVIFLSKTKIGNSYPDEQLEINGYQIDRKDRRKGGGGVMAFISRDIQSKKIKLLKNISIH